MDVMIGGMTSLPPRAVTFEHEAAHALVARRGGGSVSHIDVGISQLSPTRFSLGHTQWSPGTGNTNTLIAGYVAGPAQTRLTVQREELDAELAERAIVEEAADLAAMLRSQGHEANVSAAECLVRQYLPLMEEYLSQSDVQTAVRAITDALTSAESSESPRVEWATLEDIATWDRLPPLPTLQ